MCGALISNIEITGICLSYGLNCVCVSFFSIHFIFSWCVFFFLLLLSIVFVWCCCYLIRSTFQHLIVFCVHIYVQCASFSCNLNSPIKFISQCNLMLASFLVGVCVCVCIAPMHGLQDQKCSNVQMMTVSYFMSIGTQFRIN